MKISLEARFFCAWIVCMLLWTAAHSAGKLIQNTELN